MEKIHGLIVILLMFTGTIHFIGSIFRTRKNNKPVFAKNKWINESWFSEMFTGIYSRSFKIILFYLLIILIYIFTFLF
jgi:hypothetical protein